MAGGRPKTLTFGCHDIHLAEKATSAQNMGIKTVESLNESICYFFDGDEMAIASCTGFVRMKMSTAETIAKELPDMIEDVKNDQREGRKPMDSRSIGKMLQKDF